MNLEKAKHVAKSVSTQYFERIFDVTKHQDVIHVMVIDDNWDLYINDVAKHINVFRIEGKSATFIKAYVEERAASYAELFLNLLAERVGTQKMIEAGLVVEAPSND